MVEFGGTIHPKLYLRAMQWRRGSLVWLPLVFVIVGIIGLTAPNEAWPFYLGCLLFGIIMFVLRPLVARRQVRTNKLLHEPVRGTADENGVTMTRPHASVTLAWNDLYRASIAPDFVLLYFSAAGFTLVPRTLFADDAAWNEFRALAGARVPLTRRDPPWMIVLWVAMVLAVWAFWQLTRH